MIARVPRLRERTIRGMSHSARAWIGLMGFVFFLISISCLRNGPVGRALIAFFMLAVFLLDFLRRDIGSYAGIFRPTQVRQLSLDTKLLGVQVLASAAINIVLLIRQSLSGVT